MTTLEILGVLLIVIGVSVLFIVPINSIIRTLKPTEGICSECGHKHSMEDRAEDTAVFLPDEDPRENFYRPFDQVVCIRYKCESCKMSADIKWTKHVNSYREFLEHSKRLSQDEVDITFTRYSGKLIPHYQEKKEPPGDE